MAHKGTSVVLYRSPEIRCGVWGSWLGWACKLSQHGRGRPLECTSPWVPIGAWLAATPASPAQLQGRQVWLRLRWPADPPHEQKPTQPHGALGLRRKHQYTSITDWTGGLYISPGFAGSRSGALIATAWAAMVHLGEEGYLQSTGGRAVCCVGLLPLG